MLKNISRCISQYFLTSPLNSNRGLHCSCRNAQSVIIFDRNAKRIQRNRSAVKFPNWEEYDYLKKEIGYRVADKVRDIRRTFNTCLDLGSDRGYVGRHLTKDEVKIIFQMDMAENILRTSTPGEVPTYNIVGDEEFIPFQHNSLDLITSSLALHWVNDLPSCVKQIYNCLKADGCFIGSMFGGDTLYELRSSLQRAEEELEGGISPRISPLTTVQDVGSLLNRAGFTMVTIDVDEIVMLYPGIREVMYDLKYMGQNNCQYARRSHLSRRTQKLAGEYYRELYGVDPPNSSQEEKAVPATFQFVSWIAWKPDPNQKEHIAKRGSGQVSLKDLDRISEIANDLEKGQKETKSEEGAEINLKNLQDELEQMRKGLKLGDKKPDTKELKPKTESTVDEWEKLTNGKS